MLIKAFNSSTKRLHSFSSSLCVCLREKDQIYSYWNNKFNLKLLECEIGIRLTCWHDHVLRSNDLRQTLQLYKMKPLFQHQLKKLLVNEESNSEEKSWVYDGSTCSNENDEQFITSLFVPHRLIHIEFNVYKVNSCFRFWFKKLLCEIWTMDVGPNYPF